MVTTMTTDREALMELIRKQPPMSSERFWQQVEKARVLSPSLEPEADDLAVCDHVAMEGFATLEEMETHGGGKQQQNLAISRH
jgi:hypothetical protein